MINHHYYPSTIINYYQPFINHYEQLLLNLFTMHQPLITIMNHSSSLWKLENYYKIVHESINIYENYKPYGSKHCLRRYLSLQIIVN